MAEQVQEDRMSGWATQMIDCVVGGDVHRPRFHPSEEAARNYAADMFKRRKCDVRVISPAGRVVESLQYEGAGRIIAA